MKKRLRIWLFSILASLLLLIFICGVYVSDYYRADLEAITAFCNFENITKKEIGDGSIAYLPEKPVGGLVFYPGGKVEYTAYEPLMTLLADKGIACILVEMPFHLAVLDINAAEGIKEQFPEIETWYLAGHSLGGSMAASYLDKNSDKYEGLVLLGSYSTADLSDTSLRVLSIYGSEDKILNAEKYTECKNNLPESFTELLIEGGCHAYFGMYGNQDKDGAPTISNEEQLRSTAEKIWQKLFE